LKEKEINWIRIFIDKKLGVVFTDEEISKIVAKNAAVFSVEEIERKRKKNQLTIQELCRVLNINENTYYHQYKNTFPVGLGELIMCVIKAVGEKKEKNQIGINLMRARYNEGYSLEAAAKKLGVTEKELWHYEWQNNLPIDLIESFSKLYKIEQQKIPVNWITHENKYGSILTLVRKYNSITLKEMSQRTGCSEGRCCTYEKDGAVVPPYSYVEEMLKGTEMTVESVLLNSMKMHIKYVRIPLDTIEFYRRVYYYNTEEDRKSGIKKPRSRKAFQKEIGISDKEYESESWTVKQAKKAAELLRINGKYTILMKKLNDKQKKISNMEIDEKKLKEARIKRGLNLEMTALISGIGCSTISAIEGGKYRCSPDCLKRLADSYNSEIYDFVL
jgi:transcriptional regulator with XRE-family HTH domain